MQSFTQVSHTFPESLYNHPIVTLKTKTRVLSCIPIQRSLPRDISSSPWAVHFSVYTLCYPKNGSEPYRRLYLTKTLSSTGHDDGALRFCKD